MRASRVFSAVDSHTEGMPTRVITGGFGGYAADDPDLGWRLAFTKMLCKRPPYGGIRAIDIATGKTLWDHPFGTARKNGPFKLPTYLPLTIGTPNSVRSGACSGATERRNSSTSRLRT